MSTDTVSIGCRLPNGLKLEVGYQTSHQGAGGAPFVMYRKSADYATFTLKGRNQHLLVRNPVGKIVTTLASQIGLEPVITHGVPADLWQRWSKEHADSWLLKSGQIFVLPKTDAATVKAVTTDAKAISPNILEPLNPKEVMKIDSVSIQRRVDDDDL
jgi:hypothetical protein